jgi:thiol:disulfide interchange protein DsbD
VQDALKNVMMLRADVTENNRFDQLLLKRFHLVGPPTIIFFNQEGQELTSSRIVGEVNADEFLAQLKKIE